MARGRKRSTEDPAEAAALHALAAGIASPADLEAVFRALKQRLAKRVWDAELTEHRGLNEPLRGAGHVPAKMILLTDGQPVAMALVARTVKRGLAHLTLAAQQDSRTAGQQDSRTADDGASRTQRQPPTTLFPASNRSTPSIVTE